MAASEHHQHSGMWVFPDAKAITGDMAGKIAAMPQKFMLALTASGILFILGIVGFIARAVDDGFGDRAPWGYYAAMFSFVFMVTSTAPLAAVAFRFTKSHWRRPLSRVSELFAIVGILNILMFIPLMLVLPSIDNPDAAAGEFEVRRSIWFEGPIGSPHAWDLLGVIGLAVTALAILWISAAPDMAECRHTATGFRRWFYRTMSSHWYGTKRQWNAQKAGLALLGAFYFMLLIYVHFIISSDYAQSLIAGWKDSIFPVIYSVTGIQTALGAVIVTLFVMRRWGGYGEYLGKSTFWSASKVQLGVTLLWAYHVFAFFITYWYGRLEVEQNIIKYLFVTSYGGVFLANLLLSFVIPFAILLWNPVRRSAWGPALAGLSAIAGAAMFNIRIFVGAFNSGNVYAHALESVPSAVYPDIWDVFMVVGGIGAAVFIFLSSTKLLPMISVWEVKEGTLYQRMGRFMRGEYLVIAKPE